MLSAADRLTESCKIERGDDLTVQISLFVRGDTSDPIRLTPTITPHRTYTTSGVLRDPFEPCSIKEKPDQVW